MLAIIILLKQKESLVGFPGLIKRRRKVKYKKRRKRAPAAVGEAGREEQEDMVASTLSFRHRGNVYDMTRYRQRQSGNP